MKGKGLILKTISRLLREELMKATTAPTGSSTTPTLLTAKHMLDHLKTKFEEKDSISALLDFQLLQARSIDNGTLETQLNMFHELRTKVDTSGYKFKD